MACSSRKEDTEASFWDEGGFDGKEMYVLEINTHPGMTELSLLPEIANYAGISFDSLVEILVKNARLHKIKA